MGILRKHKKTAQSVQFTGCRPALRSSICTGEKVAGFMDESGTFREVMLITSDADLKEFCDTYDVKPGEIRTFY